MQVKRAQIMTRFTRDCFLS